MAEEKNEKKEQTQEERARVLVKEALGALRFKQALQVVKDQDAEARKGKAKS